jgi:tRNA U38,U39,U40 pseudouridine synthase TruA
MSYFTLSHGPYKWRFVVNSRHYYYYHYHYHMEPPSRVKLCEMHISQLLQTISSLTAEHTKSFLGGNHFQN